MKKIELLAPAGNMESLVAAIEAGCDAVYLGGYMFGARNYAGNFSNEQLVAAIKYAHLYGVKVYVTVNTIIYEDEVTMFVDYIDFLHRNDVDAVILQDIGMMDLITQMYPNLEIHASTQMHIHNLEGVKLAKKVGIRRTVLARETSIDLIKEIKKSIDMELEIFVHGALCISYSGQCLMSSLIGGRSGNRGTCAQSCRQKYDLISDGKKINYDKYLLSAKDLNALEYIGDLIETGVDSIKIEGRMKRPEYVYLVVSLYRKAIDNYIKNKSVNVSDDDINEMKKIFNRGFTKGFLFNEINKNIVNQYRPNHVGIEIGKVIMSKKNKVKIKLSNSVKLGDGIRIIGKDSDVGCLLTKILLNSKTIGGANAGDIIEIYMKDDIEIDSTVLKTTDIEQIKSIKDQINLKRRKVVIDAYLVLKTGQPIYLKLTDGINTVEVKSDVVVVEAINKPLRSSDILKQIKKLGNTIYEFNNINVDMSDNIFVNIKDLNEIRREAVNLLNEKRLYKSNYLKKDYLKNVFDYSVSRNLNVLINNNHQYDEVKKFEINNIYVFDETVFNNINNDTRVILKLPRVITKHQDYNKKLLVGEMGSLNYYSNIDTDFSLNVTNSYSVAFLHGLGVNQVTLSYELDDNQMKNIIDNYKKRYGVAPNLELIIYGREEVMINKFNLLDFYEVDGKQNFLKDRFNNLYPVKIYQNLMYIYNYKPRRLHNANKYYEMGINNLRINLVDEENITDLINMV
jgi:putative protease